MLLAVTASKKLIEVARPLDATGRQRGSTRTFHYDRLNIKSSAASSRPSDRCIHDRLGLSCAAS